MAHPAYITRLSNLRVLILTLLSLTACGESSDTEEVASQQSDAQATVLGPDAQTASCSEGEERVCTCTTGSTGTQFCSGGRLGECTGCAAQKPGSATGGFCVPGRYKGRSFGKYTPGPAGVCGLFTLFSGEGESDWIFDLQADGTTEFFTVGNGCVVSIITNKDGKSNADDPLRMQLTGKVDCATGKLTGELRGTYSTVSFCDLGMEVKPYFFKGSMTADFDAATKTFINGKYSVKEPPVLLPLNGQPGGEGTFSAKLSDEPIETNAAQDCLKGRVFPEEEFKNL